MHADAKELGLLPLIAFITPQCFQPAASAGVDCGVGLHMGWKTIAHAVAKAATLHDGSELTTVPCHDARSFGSQIPATSGPRR